MNDQRARIKSFIIALAESLSAQASVSGSATSAGGRIDEFVVRQSTRSVLACCIMQF
jgi:hypothetical protein